MKKASFSYEPRHAHITNIIYTVLLVEEKIINGSSMHIAAADADGRAAAVSHDPSSLNLSQLLHQQMILSPMKQTDGNSSLISIISQEKYAE